MCVRPGREVSSGRSRGLLDSVCRSEEEEEEKRARNPVVEASWDGGVWCMRWRLELQVRVGRKLGGREAMVRLMLVAQVGRRCCLSLWLGSAAAPPITSGTVVLRQRRPQRD